MSVLSPLPIRRKWIIKRELKVHLFSTLIWWVLFSALIAGSALAIGQNVPWILLAQALPLIAILEAVFFLGSILRR